MSGWERDDLIPDVLQAQQVSHAPDNTGEPVQNAHHHRRYFQGSTEGQEVGAAHLETGLAGGSKLDRLSRFSGTYSCTSSTLFTLPCSSYMAV